MTDSSEFWWRVGPGHTDEIRYRHLADRYAALAADYSELLSKHERVLRVLHDIYPALAGRVIALQASRETVALAEWDAIARRVSDATREAAMTQGRSGPQDEHTCGDAQPIATDGL